jgi:hypothetical protein
MFFPSQFNILQPSAHQRSRPNARRPPCPRASSRSVHSRVPGASQPEPTTPPPSSPSGDAPWLLNLRSPASRQARKDALLRPPSLAVASSAPFVTRAGEALKWPQLVPLRSPVSSARTESCPTMAGEHHQTRWCASPVSRYCSKWGINIFELLNSIGSLILLENS